jgi:hypothetical protein
MMKMNLDDAAKLFSLLVACPNNIEAAGCPFRRFRNVTLNDKYQFFCTLDDGQKEEMLVEHAKCSRANKTVLTAGDIDK